MEGRGVGCFVFQSDPMFHEDSVNNFVIHCSVIQ